MKILFILQYVPYPLNSGGNQATFNMIDKIREEHDVSILCKIDNEESTKALEQLREVWKDVTFFPYVEQKQETEPAAVPTTLSFRICDYIRKSFTRKVNRKLRKFHAQSKTEKSRDFVRKNSCLNQDYPTFSKGYKQHVYAISRKGFDTIQVEFYESLPLVYLLPAEVTKIYVQHEIRYIRNKNELDLFEQPTPDDFYRWNLLKDMELIALSHYDYIVALTDTDKALMQASQKDLNIYVSPAVVKLPDTQYSFDNVGQELVFVGSGEHFPNADGMMWFCKEVLPLIKKKRDVKVNIVGKWREQLQEEMLKVEPSLHFTGYVEDLDAFMNGKISIVPIRIGSGMRMKLLDSILAASPIITTSKGCEGLPFTNGETCFIANKPADFAHAVIQMLDNPGNIQKTFVGNAFKKISNIIDAKQQIQKRLNLYKVIEKLSTTKS